MRRMSSTSKVLRIGFAAAVTAVSLFTPSAGAAPLAASGTWNEPMGADSWCEQVAATTVRCNHYAHAGSSQAIGSHCQTEAVDLGPIVISGTCQVTLEGVTSGAGKVVGEDGFAPGCTTFGLSSGTVTFSDSTGFSYPVVPINIVNLGGTAQFSGSVVNSAGVTVAHTEGRFTLACGSPAGVSGVFQGEYHTA